MRNPDGLSPTRAQAHDHVPALLPAMQRPPASSKSIAVLFSGGMDSTVLVGWLAEQGRTVHPIYVRSGLFWEAAEHAAALRVIGALRSRLGSAIGDLALIDMPVGDLYGDHWSTTGRGVPDQRSEDAAVFLPGRNPLLLMKAALWCVSREILQLALGTLSCNPFPDATPAFFTAFEEMVHRATGVHLQLVRPFTGSTKQDLAELGRRLPLDLTFSCLAPVAGMHCGQCNKCAERQRVVPLFRHENGRYVDPHKVLVSN